MIDKAFKFIHEALEMRRRLSKDEVDPLAAKSLDNVVRRAKILRKPLKCTRKRGTKCRSPSFCKI